MFFGLFEEGHSLFDFVLSKCNYPDESLLRVNRFLLETGQKLTDDYYLLSPHVWVHKSVKIEPYCYLLPPAIIGEGTVIRKGAYLRGNVLVGKNCVIGNATELKNCVLFDEAKVPHFNYVGDSILGFRAHLGAGTICSNVKGDGSSVSVTLNGEKRNSNRVKCGCFLGDGAEVGCHCVLNPGTVVGTGTRIYPNLSLRGEYQAFCLVKDAGRVVPLKNN